MFISKAADLFIRVLQVELLKHGMLASDDKHSYFLHHRSRLLYHSVDLNEVQRFILKGTRKVRSSREFLTMASQNVPRKQTTR